VQRIHLLSSECATFDIFFPSFSIFLTSLYVYVCRYLLYPYFFVQKLFLFDEMFAIDFQFALHALEILSRFILSAQVTYMSHDH